MISFRIREPGEPEWTQVSFNGADEELAAHLLASMLASAGWTILVAKDSQDFHTLDESEDDFS